MSLAKFAKRLFSNNEGYFLRVKEKLEKEGYYVSELGLIQNVRGDYEDNMGDIRKSEKRVVILPSKMYHPIEISQLINFLKSERIPFRDKGHYS